MSDGRLTIKDIARLSGVGISTVSRVVNKRPDVNEATRLRVMEVVEREGYVPNGNAKHLKQISTDSVAVIVRGTNNTFLTAIVQEIQRYIERAGLHFLSHYIDERDDEIVAAYNIYTERKVCGIIFMGGSLIGREKELSLIPVPCVFSTLSAADTDLPNVYSVSVDDRAAARKAVDFLFDCGHEDIMIVGGAVEQRSAISLRYRGAMDSFEAHGKPFDADHYLTTTFSLESSYRAMQGALDKKFTAVFAMSDTMAIGAAKALTDSGRRIPEDVSIIGFDGIDIAFYYNPTMATVRQPQKDIAKQSVMLLMRALEEEPGEKHITLETELLEGHSVRRIR